jgi:hypothetical protein
MSYETELEQRISELERMLEHSNSINESLNCSIDTFTIELEKSKELIWDSIISLRLVRGFSGKASQRVIDDVVKDLEEYIDLYDSETKEIYSEEDEGIELPR